MAPLVAPAVSAADAWINIQSSSNPGNHYSIWPIFALALRATIQPAFRIREVSAQAAVMSGDWASNTRQASHSADGRQTTDTTTGFRSLADLIQGRFFLLLIDRALSVARTNRAGQAFVQDSFRASPRLTLDCGIRYGVRPAPSNGTGVRPILLDYESLPNPHPASTGSPLWKTSWADIAPRLVATYQLATRNGTRDYLADWMEPRV